MRYTGIGNRDITLSTAQTIADVATLLDTEDFVLRTGCARGSDYYFRTSSHNCEVYDVAACQSYENYKEAIEIAKMFHPYYKSLDSSSKKLHNRTSYQLLGRYLTEPSDFVLCYTRDGCENGIQTTKATGGSGQALRIACHYNIPVFNIRNNGWLVRLEEFITNKKKELTNEHFT